MESIAAMSMDVASLQMSESYSIGICKMTMQSQEQAAQQMIEAMQAANPVIHTGAPVPPLGAIIDTYG